MIAQSKRVQSRENSQLLADQRNFRLLDPPLDRANIQMDDGSCGNKNGPTAKTAIARPPDICDRTEQLSPYAELSGAPDNPQ